ncbi:MAG: cyclophilin-like fold protein [Thermoproteota archaeon]|nr:cyclophilin-like fold protein [Thermoproteota archaeon]
MSEESISQIPIKFVVEGSGEAEGQFIRYLAPRTIKAIVNQLPLEGRAALWKEEVYFKIPLKMGGEKAKSNVEKGTIAYWPMGTAICIFYGQTQPYSPVNVLGKVAENLELFRKVKSGAKIRVEKR